MFTGILLSAALLSPAAPVPKATKPLGPPPKLVYVPAAGEGGQVVVVVQFTRKVTETVETVEAVNGVPVKKTVTRERDLLTSKSVALENAGATFKTAADKPLTAAEANDRLKAGGALVVPAAGEDAVDPAYVKLLAADAIVVSYPADKPADEKKRLAVGVLRVGAAVAPPPTIVAVKADATGALTLPARGTKEETVKVPVAKVVDGQTQTEYVETKRTVMSLVPTPFDQVKPDVTTADGKPVAVEDAKKQLAAGAVVLVSADGKPVDERYRKLFQPGTLALASEKLVAPAPVGLVPALVPGQAVQQKLEKQ